MDYKTEFSIYKTVTSCLNPSYLIPLQIQRVLKRISIEYTLTFQSGL